MVLVKGSGTPYSFDRSNAPRRADTAMAWSGVSMGIFVPPFGPFRRRTTRRRSIARTPSGGTGSTRRSPLKSRAAFAGSKTLRDAPGRPRATPETTHASAGGSRTARPRVVALSGRRAASAAVSATIETATPIAAMSVDKTEPMAVWQRLSRASSCALPICRRVRPPRLRAACTRACAPREPCAFFCAAFDRRAAATPRCRCCNWTTTSTTRTRPH
mmetsp:Transcript_4881/g.14799  ORF Transcript_4881/g.14799 Transcript_4881/m.14799 type:complete len:216 (-) Transcript_4881:376-1023(-)